MVFTLESAEWLHTNFKEGTIDVVESKQADEGAEGWSVDRKGPIGNQIELGLGWAVAGGCDVMTDIFDAVGKELAFLQLESDAAQTHSNRRRRAATTVDHKRMSSMMIRLPRCDKSDG